MSFAQDMARFKARYGEKAELLHNALVERVFESIVEGSALTGAPGQPVRTSTLKGSWRRIPTRKFRDLVVTNVRYAPYVEDGIGSGGRPMTLRSEVGGWHSVKLTRAGWDKIVADATREIMGA